MKKILSLFVFVFTMNVTLAQPSNVQKVSKSVFTLTTFKKDGSILASSKGVFVGPQGEALSAWTPFVGADSAIVIDASGKKMNVEALYGANELYDVCKFRVEGSTLPAPLAKAALAAGGKAWLVEYATTKAKIVPISVKNAETFMTTYNYYTYNGEYPAINAGCPIVNNNGEVMGLVQFSKINSEAHSTDARFMNSFQTNGFSINDPVLTQANIRVMLPEQQDMAAVMLMFSGNQSNLQRHQKYVTEYLARFPKSIDGYVAQARIDIVRGQYAQATSIMEKAIATIANKDDAYYNYAQLIYEKEISSGTQEYQPWNLDVALKEVEKAIAIKNLPVYKHLEAQILYSKGEYQKAYDIFMSLTKTDFRSGELYYEASQAKRRLNAPTEEILTLLDSAVACHPAHLAAPYILARGTALYDAKQYRRAIQDFNKYDTLMLGRANHEFYYLKFNAEVQAKQYQLALNDIAHAIVLNRTEPAYYVEMAQLQLRVNMPDDALKTIELCHTVAPDNPESYLIQGLAYMEKKQKAEGLKAFRRAKELGSEQADALIEKYK